MLDQTLFNKSGAGFLLGGDQSSHPPSGLGAASSKCPQGTRPQAPAPVTTSPCRCRHQPHINLELYASYVYLSMSYTVDPDGVALKNSDRYFLHQFHEEREHAEMLMKLQNQWGGWMLNSSGYQVTKLWGLGEPAQCNKMCVSYTWKKHKSVITGPAPTGPWQKQPPLVWLHWDSIPKWAGEIHQRIGWPRNQLV